MRYILYFLVLALIPVQGIAQRRTRSIHYNSRAYQAAIRTQAQRPQWAFLFETRPSFPANGAKKAYGESLVELGVRMTPDRYVGFEQQFTNNYYNNNPALEDGPQLQLADGYFVAQFKNVWKDGGQSLSIEPRFYLPTDESLRDKGMLTRIRLFFDYRNVLNSTLAFHLIEGPIVHAYSKVGSGNETDGYSANPVFENRFYLASSITFSSWCNLWLPLRLQSINYSDYRSGAKNNGIWTHSIILNPELTFVATQNLSLGLAYQTSSLVTEDLSGSRFSDGFANGITQLILRLSF